jgi:hypothetical protein
MGSRVALSDSGSSMDSVTSRAPPPPLRSVVVALAGQQLGSRGWDTGAGPSRPAGVDRYGGDVGEQWHTMGPRWARNARRAQSCSHQQQCRPLPASRPPQDDAAAPVPEVLHGCCYNCGLEGHISAESPNDTVCMHCGGSKHTSRDCKRPRSVEGSPPLLDAPPLRRPVAPPVPRLVGCAGPPVVAPLPPPPPATDGARSWHDVVGAEAGS